LRKLKNCLNLWRKPHDTLSLNLRSYLGDNNLFGSSGKILGSCRLGDNFWSCGRNCFLSFKIVVCTKTAGILKNGNK